MSTAELPATDPDLVAGLDRVWRRLEAAVGDAASPLRTPVVATAGDDGADGRVMVLRAVDRAAGTLTFFTDVRAGKVATIDDAPGVAVIAYDAGDRLQLRLRGRAAIATAGAAVERLWAIAPHASRRAYRTIVPPGTPAESVAVAARLGDGDGRGNFAVLTVGIDTIEWLDLAASEHRRAVHTRVGQGWDGSWRVP